jgi:hypothetical protein
METTLPFPIQRPGRASGPQQPRRRPTRQATGRSGRRPTHRLDARTREIGLAGVASARLVLAACRSGTGVPTGPTDRDPTDGEGPACSDEPTGNDDPAGALPVGDAHRHLPEAA